MEIGDWIVTNLPNLGGIAVLAWFLITQNNRLLDTILSRVEKVEERLTAIEVTLQSKGDK